MMRRIIRVLVVLIVFAAIAGFVAYDKIFGSNSTAEDKELYIPSGTNYEQLIGLLESGNVINDVSSFQLVSKLMKYGARIRSGYFKIPGNVSNRELIQLLRAGEQNPVDVTISTARQLNDVAGVISKSIEADSISIHKSFLDSEFLSDNDLDSATAISIVIPNTYELFWDTDAQGLTKRLEKEYNRFWNPEREAKRESLGMSRSEVATLASIVEKESNLPSEKPTIAGLYINRLANNIPLQADPTVVFGIGDFTIRRVLNRHLEIDTPYNTYKNPGLPIGPICMPSISSIDAVLNYEKHDYIFMCAKPGYNNGHAFAENNIQHARNARRYHEWLDQEGIRG